MERDVSTPCLYTPSAKHLSSTTPAARPLNKASSRPIKPLPGGADEIYADPAGNPR